MSKQSTSPVRRLEYIWTDLGVASRAATYEAIKCGDLETFLIGRRRYTRDEYIQKWFDYLEAQSAKGAPVVYQPRNRERSSRAEGGEASA